MEQKFIAVHIACPHHPSELIQRVSTNTHSPQNLFCMDCILQQVDKKSLDSHLRSLPDFITLASHFYSQNKDTIRPTPQAPDEYTAVLSKQTETLDALTQHIADQRYRVEAEFVAAMQIITEQKNKHLPSFGSTADEPASLVQLFSQTGEEDISV